MFNKVQHIGSVIGNNNIIVNGDIVADEVALSRIAEHLLKDELSHLTEEARAMMQDSVNKCVDSILEKIVEQHLEEILTDFSNPSTQFAFYSTLKGYSSSDTIEQQELLVDAFIERMQKNRDSSEKMIIDSAIEILPKLNPTLLSTLGVLQLRSQIAKVPFGLILTQYFSSLTPLVERVASITSLDIEYLKQERLLLPIPGIRPSATLEQYMLAQYDLFFRHPLDKRIYDEYCACNPSVLEPVTDIPIKAGMMWINSTNNDAVSFCCPNSKLLNTNLIERHQEYIIPHVENFKVMMPPFSEDEVRAYFIALSPFWEHVFSIFSSDDFTQYTLSITGNYIGGKIIALASHNKPLALANYNTRMSL